MQTESPLCHVHNNFDLKQLFNTRKCTYFFIYKTQYIVKSSLLVRYTYIEVCDCRTLLLNWGKVQYVGRYNLNWWHILTPCYPLST